MQDNLGQPISRMIDGVLGGILEKLKEMFPAFLGKFSK